MSLFNRRLPQQRQVFRNEGTSSLEVMIEMIPHRYVLQPGDEMVLLADAPPTNEGFTVNARTAACKSTRLGTLNRLSRSTESQPNLTGAPPARTPSFNVAFPLIADV